MLALAPIQAETLDRFLAAWKNQDAKGIVALWSDDFKQRLLPLSLHAPVKSRAEAEVMNGKLMDLLTNWQVSCPFPFFFVFIAVVLTFRICSAGNQRDRPRCPEGYRSCLRNVASGYPYPGREMDQ